MRPGRRWRSVPGLALAAASLGLMTAVGGGTAEAQPVKKEEQAAAPTHPHDPHHHHAASGAADGPGSPTPAFQREMDAGMVRMMAGMHSAGHSGDVDVDFLAMMIPHHEGAIDMARLVLQHGRDPATRMLAEEIIAGQTIEVESMQRRLGVLRQQHAGASVPPEFPALGGTRGP